MIELLASCGTLAVPLPVMAAVVQVESGGNRYAIGVVGGELERQPNNLREAAATAAMLEKQGYNYSLGAAQINKKNFAAYGITSPEQAFDYCTSVRTGARILAECQQRAQGDWGKAFSCYYSGNFATGFRDGYVQKVAAAWQGIPLQQRTAGGDGALPATPLRVAQWDGGRGSNAGPNITRTGSPSSSHSGVPSGVPTAPPSLPGISGASRTPGLPAGAGYRSDATFPSAPNLNPAWGAAGVQPPAAAVGGDAGLPSTQRPPARDGAFVF